MAGHIEAATNLLTVALIAWCTYRIVHRLFISPLKAYPGPWLHAISEIPIEIARAKGAHAKHLQELHAKYGPVVRVRPTEISIIDGSAWPEVYGYRPNLAEFPKADTGNRTNGVHGILTTPNRNQHRRDRRMLAHAFSAQGMREQENRIVHYVDLLVSGLTAQASKGPVNVVDWFNWTTFDIIGDLAFGESFGCLESQATHPWIGFILRSLKAGLLLWMAARWGLLYPISFLIPKRLMEARNENYRFVVEKMKTRVALGKDRGDFWDHVLKHPILPEDVSISSPDIKGMSLKEMESSASDLVLAGSETTATLLSGLTFQLLKHPDVLRRLTDEVRSTFADEAAITLLAVTSNQLPYLSAVLQEAMRTYAPAPLPTGRVLPPGGATVNGVFLPCGTRIGVPHVVAYRSAYNFTRPDEFLPERWLPEADVPTSEFANDNRHNVFQPFSFGPRNCIGTNLANAEMRLIVTKLLWRFELQKPPGAGVDWESWMDRQPIWVLWHKSPLMVSLRERKPA